jgi:hypothetical protein
MHSGCSRVRRQLWPCGRWVLEGRRSRNRRSGPGHPRAPQLVPLKAKQPIIKRSKAQPPPVGWPVCSSSPACREPMLW